MLEVRPAIGYISGRVRGPDPESGSLSFCRKNPGHDMAIQESDEPAFSDELTRVEVFDYNRPGD